MDISKMKGTETVMLSREVASPAIHPQTHFFDHELMWNHLLASNVKHFRGLKKVSQESLAQECGIYRTYLSKIETGKCNPSLSVLVALASALDILPHALLAPLQ